MSWGTALPVSPSVVGLLAKLVSLGGLDGEAKLGGVSLAVQGYVGNT